MSFRGTQLFGLLACEYEVLGLNPARDELFRSHKHAIVQWLASVVKNGCVSLALWNCVCYPFAKQMMNLGITYRRHRYMAKGIRLRCHVIGRALHNNHCSACLFCEHKTIWQKKIVRTTWLFFSNIYNTMCADDNSQFVHLVISK